MFVRMLQQLLGSALKKQGQKMIDADEDHEGKDDIAGTAMVAMGGVIETVNFDPNNVGSLKSAKNIVAALRAAADEIEEALETEAAK